MLAIITVSIMLLTILLTTLYNNHPFTWLSSYQTVGNLRVNIVSSHLFISPTKHWAKHRAGAQQVPAECNVKYRRNENTKRSDFQAYYFSAVFYSGLASFGFPDNSGAQGKTFIQPCSQEGEL